MKPETVTPAPPHTAPELFAGYRPSTGAYDELIDADGHPRRKWTTALRGLDALGPDALDQRWAAAQRVISENGVTYNVYSDPRGVDRPWQLDPVPLVIDQREWAALEEALIQRARVLNLILKDLYGPQRLLQDNLLPPELLFAHPHFLRPMHGTAVPGDQYLNLYAADLARNPDGTWWVVNDRTQAPSGSGYALENRVVLSRTVPLLFRDCGVQRLATYFARMRENLIRLAPHNKDNPRIVVLTPGPYNETYFEHAYLARYLGFPLVEGGDLTVRDNQVFLKTLGGLLRVDVILRRVDDTFCDPLELRGDSMLGVTGLVQAVAARQVSVANPLGSGAVEGSALTAFIPALCQSLLGEELKLPSVASWWCGQPSELTYVLEHLDRLVVKPAFPGLSGEPVFGPQMTPDGRAELAERIKARPHHFVGQESVALSTGPVWQDGAVTPRHLMFRAFVAATRDGYTVMPGGLVRCSADADSMVVSMQRGGGSKDAWVLTDEPISRLSLLKGVESPVELERGGHDLPSRLADSLYWLGRYVERADMLARLLRSIARRLTEETSPHGTPELPSLLAALDDAAPPAPRPPAKDGATAPRKRAPTGRLDHEDRLLDAIHATDLPSSLRNALDHARRLATIVRDRVSVDAWRVVNQLRRVVGDNARLNDASDALALLDDLLVPLAAFQGHTTESMTHGMGWRFLDLGRRIERATATVGLLRALIVQPAPALIADDDGPDERPLLDVALEVCASAMTYRSRYRSRVTAMPVIDLLVLDETNPRSIAYQLVAIHDHTDVLHRPVDDGARAEEQRQALRALSAAQLANAADLATLDPSQRRVALAQLLDLIDATLPELSDTITQRYLSHAQPSRRLGRAIDAIAKDLTGDEETTL
ncbi:MAG: circularly permuted type 2 ATP-grasp protein [Planctomycetota bacterium]